MTNQEISWKLKEVVTYLELKGEAIGKINELKKASEIVLKLKPNLIKMQTVHLKAINGLSDRAIEIIQSILQLGDATLLNQLRQAVPKGLVEMLAIPKLEASDISIIYRKLGIKDLDNLTKAARSKKIRKLPGLGSKTELAIIRGFKMIRENLFAAPIGIAKSLGQELTRDFAELEQVKRLQLVGDVRRNEEMVSRVQIAIATASPNEVLEIISKHPQIKKIIKKSHDELLFTANVGVVVQILIVAGNNFGGFTHLLTGTDEYLQEMVKIARQKGIDLARPDTYSFEKEDDLFAALDMAFIQPELRDSREIIEKAVENCLPELVAVLDIRGDLHCHSNWSDGVAEIEEMVNKAEEIGYEYLAITDHSKSLTVAGGLSEDKLLKQKHIISELNKSLDDIEVFAGIEADILKNGQLDYQDDLLAEMDLVIASVHTGFQLEEKEMTDRITTAMKNEHVNILAHPTGRILGTRKGYRVNVEEIIDVAVKTNTVLEINSSIDRLDLNHVLAKKAEEAGVRLAINTDCHDPLHFKEIEYGVNVAKKAQLSKESVINTYSLERLEEFLHKQKKY